MPWLSSPPSSPRSCITAGLVDLGRGVVWHCCPLVDARPLPYQAELLAHRVRSEFDSRLGGSADEVLEELFHAPNSPSEQASCFRSCAGGREIGILVPEASAELDFCRWDGDGHYDVSRIIDTGPPTLGQVMAFVQMVSAAADRTCLTIHLTSECRRATGAVLAGAVLVLAGGLTAEAAWAEVLLGCPKPCAKPEEAWDRFPCPFSRSHVTNSSSLTVLDCLAGLEFARDANWLCNFHHFDVSAWRLLRQKFDASWLIPGEMLALANPWGTAQNPAFPGLLSPAVDVAWDEPVMQAGRDMSTSPHKRTCVSPALSSSHSSDESLMQRVDIGSAYLDEDGLTEPDVDERGFEMVGLEDTPFSASAVAYGAPSFSLPGGVGTGGPHVAWSRPAGVASPNKDGAIPELELLMGSSFMTYLHAKGIRTIARLNLMHECEEQAHYIKLFDEQGFHTVACPFDDGQVPPKATVKAFLSSCRAVREQGSQAIAVHCMGGLGRTGVMVGVYAVGQHGISGTAFHGWARMCRPGSVQTHCQERFLRALRPKRLFLPKTSSIPSISSLVGEAVRKVSSVSDLSKYSVAE